MLKHALSTVKAKQPIAITGMFAHTYYWITSPSGDLSYQNPSYQNEQNPETTTAIYFIHGTADQATAFTRIAERLLLTGLPSNLCSLNLLSFEQRYHGKSIAHFAEQLKDKILANQHQRVILIAHSRGGLVAAYFAEYLAAVAHITVPQVMTLGTPFNGSYLAVSPLSWFSDSVKEMTIDSEFLLQLKKDILQQSKSNYHFFIATEDAIVPGEAGFIKEYVDTHPGSLITIDRHGHLSLMSSHRVVSLIAQLLGGYLNNSLSEPEPAEVIVSQWAQLTVIEEYEPLKLQDIGDSCNMPA